MSFSAIGGALLALLVFHLLGDLFVQSTGLPLPGAMVGLVLLLVTLQWRGRATPPGLQATAGQLLRHMMLMLAPVVAGVVVHADTLAREWLPFLVACVLGAFLTFGVTALVFHWALRRQQARDGVAAHSDRAAS